VLASVTDTLTSFVGDHGLYAVFALMLVDAVLPAASELVMLYAGALAAGAFAGQNVVFFGERVSSGFWAFVVMTLAGAIGYTVGSIAGWAIGFYGGRPYLERHGRWLHVSPARLERAERWFDRFGDAAVFLGRITPVVRSFISIPAGVFRMEIVRFTVLSFLGTLIWCAGLAGIGWALGSHYERFHHEFRWVEYAVAALLVAGVVYLVLKRRATGRVWRNSARRRGAMGGARQGRRRAS
jgi:membrane protein DedA with SNARE-associated domain